MVNRRESLAVALLILTVAGTTTAQSPSSPSWTGDPILAYVADHLPIDGFGTDPQVAILSPIDLVSDNPATTLGYLSGGYRYIVDDGGGFLKVGLSPGTDLPVGALITAACLQAADFRTDGQVRLAMWAFEQPTVPGNSPYVQLISDWQGSGVTWSSGYTAVCVLPGVTFSTFGDLDTDGASGRISYAFGVDIDGPAGNQLAIGSISILWSYQISPAPATATFGDVPVGAFGFQHVEALAASGITAGCGGGNFCPEQPLTRVQMAIFLAKALGLHWPK